MTLSQDDRIQHLYHSALKQPESKQEEWLRENCWGDEGAVSLVMSMLNGEGKSISSPNPPAASDSISLLPPDRSAQWPQQRIDDPSSVDSFVERLSESGVLTPKEIDELVAKAEKNKGAVTPRGMASQLVDNGKLTDFQASVLMDGQRKLLIDKYVVLDVLDAGGMGTVFKAVHRPMHRLVAIKMISQQILASNEQVRRFRREVRVAATLEHPNIVRAYDADETNGMHFLVMEYVRGQNLSNYVQQKGPMPVERATLCILQAAKALKYAHSRGIVHRDIKPGNLMIAKGGVVKVLDLGLASIDDSSTRVETSIPNHSALDTGSISSSNELTRSGSILGTVSFMAPEQSIDAAKADHRADIYSLGCTLFYLLTGEPPYRGAPLEVLFKHRDAEIPSLISKRADVPEKLDAVCAKMLAKKPEDRYQSIAELVDAIDACRITKVKNRGSKSRQEPKPQAPLTDEKSVARTSEDGSQRSGIGRVIKRFVVLMMVLAVGYGGFYSWQNNPGFRTFVNSQLQQFGGQTSGDDESAQPLDSDSHPLSIIDGDKPEPPPPPTEIVVSLGDEKQTEIRQPEGQRGTSLLKVPISLSRKSDEPVAIGYRTVDGSASSRGKDADFQPISDGTITFAAGETQKFIEIEILGDKVREKDEQFILELTDAELGEIQTSEVQIRIMNDDEILVAIGESDTSQIQQTEGQTGTSIVSIPVTLSAPSDQEVEVAFRTIDGSATSQGDSVDYIPVANGRVSFAPGETKKNIDIELLGDAQYESSETFAIELTEAKDCEIKKAKAHVTIVNDDQFQSKPGRIDFAKVQRGQLPQNEWNINGNLGVNLNDGIPCLKVTGAGPNPPRATNNTIQLGGHFFIEAEIVDTQNNHIEFNLQSSTTGEAFGIKIGSNRLQDWYYDIGQGPSATGLSNRIGDLRSVWFRIENIPGKGVFLFANGDSNNAKKIGKELTSPFDSLELRFVDPIGDIYLQNLRWGPVNPTKDLLTKPFGQNAAGNRPRIPNGWNLIGQEDPDKARRLVSDEVSIGKDFRMTFIANVQNRGQFALALIGEKGGMTLPISFTFGQFGSVVEIAACGAKRNDIKHINGVRYPILIERVRDQVFISVGNANNTLAVDCKEIQNFERIELNFQSLAAVSIEPPIRVFPVILKQSPPKEIRLSSTEYDFSEYADGQLPRGWKGHADALIRSGVLSVPKGHKKAVYVESEPLQIKGNFDLRLDHLVDGDGELHVTLESENGAAKKVILYRGKVQFGVGKPSNIGLVGKQREAVLSRKGETLSLKVPGIAALVSKDRKSPTYNKLKLGFVTGGVAPGKSQVSKISITHEQ